MIFTPSVGVSPGTTMMQLGSCPPNPVIPYVMPPIVSEYGGPWGSSRSARNMPSLGIDGLTTYNPYADFVKLQGFRGLTPPRWGLVLFAGLSVFTVMLLLLRRKRR
jgi:hypothetical protein